MRYQAFVMGAMLLVLETAAPVLAAQRRATPAAGQDATMTAEELERHFDAYVVVQAQEALQLNDAQFQRILPRLRVLQQARRRAVQQHRRALAELSRMLRVRTLDEARAREGLRRVREIEERTCLERQRAYDNLNAVLDVAQQVRFKVFEEQVERRKVELVMRARRSAAARQEK